jgi:hypothetical protein
MRVCCWGCLLLSLFWAAAVLLGDPAIAAPVSSTKPAIPAAPPVSPSVPESQLGELMDASGLTRQLAQIQPGMLRAIESTIAEERLDEEAAARLRKAVKSAYSSEALTETVRAEVANRLAAADIDAVLVFLHSEIGKRITQIEENAGEAAEEAKRDRDAADLLASLPAPRVALMNRMATATDSAESGARMMILTTVAMAQGVAYATPGSNRAEIEALKQQLESRRAELVQQSLDDALESMAHTYRSLSDADFEVYVKFAETAAGRRYHDATGQALEVAMGAAALRLGALVSGGQST